MTNRKSHIRPFDWCQNQRPCMTLNGRYAFCSIKDASFGAHHKKLNEDIPILLAAKCRPLSLVSDDIRFLRIFAGVLWRMTSNDSGV